MRVAMLAVALVACAGCAADLDVVGQEWAKPAAGMQQVTLDEMACVRAATDAGRSPDPIVGGVADAVRFALREGRRMRAYERCMADRGYARKAG